MFVLLLALFLLLHGAQAQAPGSLRLRGGLLPQEGRVEVFVSGRWGSVCDDGWSMQDAVVACKQLGFIGAVKEVKNAFYGRGVGDIWLDEMGCKGTESLLLNCSHYGIGNHDCTHHQDAGVVCLMEGAVRLVDGVDAAQGRVEVYHGTSWGTVCDDNFGRREGDTTCRQLGYTRLRQYFSEAEFGAGSGPVWLDDVNCTESHVRLSDCSSAGWGNHNCSHDEDVGVICEGIPREPERPRVGQVTCTTAALHWLTPYGSGRPVTLHYIQYRPRGRTQWTQIRQRPLRFNQVVATAVLTDLRPGTTYEVAVAARNVVGNSSFSEVVTMATKSISFDAPMIRSAVSDDRGKIVISWEHGTSLHCGISATAHLIQWSSVNGHRSIILTDTSFPLTNYTLFGAHPLDQYNLSVSVGMATKLGYYFSPPSDNVSVVVKATAPHTPPGMFHGWPINSSAIHFLWQCQSDHVILGHVIFCQSGSQTWHRNVTIATGCQYLFQDLLPDESYTCMVASFNKVGRSLFSEPITMDTAPADPILLPTPVPFDVYVQAVSANSITLWLQPESHDAPDEYVYPATIGYNVTCWSSQQPRTVAALGRDVNITIGNLLSNQNYRCEVVAVSRFGSGDPVTVAQRTLSTAPIELPRQLFISDSNNKLYLNWLPPATDDIITDYHVSCVLVKDGQYPFDPRLHDNDNGPWTKLLSENGFHHRNNQEQINVALPSFAAGQLTSCRVAAVNERGRGPYAYHASTVTPTAIDIKVTGLEAAVNETNSIYLHWQPLPPDDIIRLSVIGYLLNCGKDQWQRFVWNSQLSGATVYLFDAMATEYVECTVSVINSIGLGPASEPILVNILHGANMASGSSQWNTKESTSYVLLAVIGFAIATIALISFCICYCVCCHRNHLFGSEDEVVQGKQEKENNYSQEPHYEVLDVYDHKTTPPNFRAPPVLLKTAPPRIMATNPKTTPLNEEYMDMASSSPPVSELTNKTDTLRSCHVTSTFNSCDVKNPTYQNTDQSDCHGNMPDTSHYDVLPSRSIDHYDTPTNNQLATSST